ncbi:MAG TPA: serine/threonine-protein kinase [Ktedonobacteraceae bacterium]|nr:serine/threonine-protein kinase [Ktedonobacteraceae bacterium]
METTLPMESIVGERYRVESLLGRGGFGSVYLVRDLRVKQNIFALKEVVDPDQRQRRHFTLEAELLKRADHPSLPRVYRAFDEPAQGRAYLLMDYIEGPNLEQLRRQRPGQRLPWREALELVGPIFEAVAYLHAQHPPIIHRDIKPSNIIAPTSGARTVLVDLGIAKEFDQDATTTAIRHASPGYGAPEQYSTGTDTRTDVYGLGATLYVLLTGTVPTDAFFRLTQHLGNGSDALQPVNQLFPEIPEHISAAIARAMALESSERFATVEEFWQALQPDTLPGPLAAPAYSSARAAPWPIPDVTRPTVTNRPVPVARSRRRGGIAALLLVLLALCVGLASAFVLPKLHGQQANSPTAIPKTTATHAATATLTSRPTQTATPVATATATATATPAPPLPVLASAYAGTIYDNNGAITTSMSLNGIGQHQQNIQGNFHVDPPLNGSGPFTGTVDSQFTIQFTVHSSDRGAGAPLFFSGTIQQNGSMGGHYCSLDSTGHCNPAVGGFGTWSVQSVSASS